MREREGEKMGEGERKGGKQEEEQMEWEEGVLMRQGKKKRKYNEHLKEEKRRKRATEDKGPSILKIFFGLADGQLPATSLCRGPHPNLTTRWIAD